MPTDSCSTEQRLVCHPSTPAEYTVLPPAEHSAGTLCELAAPCVNRRACLITWLHVPPPVANIATSDQQANRAGDAGPTKDKPEPGFWCAPLPTENPAAYDWSQGYMSPRNYRGRRGYWLLAAAACMRALLQRQARAQSWPTLTRPAPLPPPARPPAVRAATAVNKKTYTSTLTPKTLAGRQRHRMPCQ
jgi:hypothetical protein